MAIGDDAVAAGMAVTTGGEAANTIDTELNKTRDYVANGHTYWKSSAIVPIAKGGTNASTASAARTSLDVYAKANTVNTNGTYNIELQSPDGIVLHIFINGVFRGVLP